MAPSKKVQDAKAKAKKQKIYAIVGAVLLLAVLGYEIPNTMKLMKQSSGQTDTSSSQPAATTTKTVSTTPAAGTLPADGSLTPPTLSGSAPASTPSSSGGLVNSDPAPAAAAGQLIEFDRFVAKDPFKQQLAVTGTSSSGSSSSPGGTSTTPGGTSTTPGGTTTTPGGTTTTPGGSAVPPSGPTTTPTPPPANPTIATISVNGVPEDVQVGGTFPKSAAQPFFQLVAFGQGSVKIGIAGGSLAGGGQTVTIALGKKVTLMNTADGTKYALVLVALK